MSWGQGRVWCLLPPVPQAVALNGRAPWGDRAPSSVPQLHRFTSSPHSLFKLKAEVVLGIKPYLEWQYYDPTQQLNKSPGVKKNNKVIDEAE